MSRRRVEIVILCEDVQHRAFAKGVFESRGFRKIRFLPIPMGKGAATQYVYKCYPERVKAYRVLANRNKFTHALAVFVDADKKSVRDRLSELDAKLVENDMPRRKDDEKIAAFIPKRHIETWLMYLMQRNVDGKTVNEKISYKSKYGNKYSVKSCIPYAKKFGMDICPSDSLPQNAPPSLRYACKELERVL